MVESKRKAALYMRLSKEDNAFSEESASIATQREILLDFMSKAGIEKYNEYKEYIDDGYSGTSFERPAFMQMVRDIKSGKIAIVITKDLSRLGRNSARAADFLDELLPVYGVRFISVSEGIDSAVKQSNKLAPITNVVNEWYSADISDKIKDALAIKMKNGDYIGSFAPFGYRKDPDNKNHLIIDEEAAIFVQKIFAMARQGESPSQIAQQLNSQCIPSPLQYRYEHFSHINNELGNKKLRWVSGSVAKLLRSKYYLGHTEQGKTKKHSYKSKRSVAVGKKEWIIVHNTHEPLIDKDCFNTVQRLMEARSCNNKLGKQGFVNIFSGLAKCADCRRNMSSTGTRKRGSPAYLCCGGYKLYGKGKCNNHHIDYNVLYTAVLEALRQSLVLTNEDRLAIANNVQRSVKQSLAYTADHGLQTKICLIHSKLEQLYDDKYSGKIAAEQFEGLCNRYTGQLYSLEDRLEQCSKAHLPSLQELGSMLEELTKLSKLDSKLLFTLIERIEVYQGKYTAEVKSQRIRIYLKYSCNNS